MNPIETLEAEIKRAIPSAVTRVDRPRLAEGSWWLDAGVGENLVVVEWSPRRGFGVSAFAPDDVGYRLQIRLMRAEDEADRLEARAAERDAWGAEVARMVERAVERALKEQQRRSAR